MPVISGRDKKMESKRGILTVLAVAAVFVLVCLPCTFAQDDSDRDQPPNRPRMERPGQRGGPGSGNREGGRRGPGGGRQGRGGRPGRPDDWWRRPELTDEQINSVLVELAKRDPNTAKELAELRKTDPNEFRFELRRSAGQEIGKIMIESFREIQHKDFLEWLEKYVPKEAEPLTKLKESDPKLYAQKFDLLWDKYRWIYDLTRRRPELTPVLIEDMQLAERENELVKQIKAEKDDKQKAELMNQLEKVESSKYDLIVRRKQIEYEELLRRLQALQNEVQASLADIEEWKNEKVKADRVEERVKDLTTERGRRFNWRSF
jgi:hypothetical protein